MAWSAFLPLTGFPFLMAVATVSGCSSGTKFFSLALKALATGAEPSACMPVSMGTLSIQPTSLSSETAL